MIWNNICYQGYKMETFLSSFDPFKLPAFPMHGGSPRLKISLSNGFSCNFQTKKSTNKNPKSSCQIMLVNANFCLRKILCLLTMPKTLNAILMSTACKNSYEIISQINNNSERRRILREHQTYLELEIHSSPKHPAQIVVTKLCGPTINSDFLVVADLHRRTWCQLIG